MLAPPTGFGMSSSHSEDMPKSVTRSLTKPGMLAERPLAFSTTRASIYVENVFGTSARRQPTIGPLSPCRFRAARHGHETPVRTV